MDFANFMQLAEVIVINPYLLQGARVSKIDNAS